MKTVSQVQTKDILKTWARKAIGPSRYEFLLKMTLLYLILYSSKLLMPNDARWFPIAAKFLAVSMLLFPALLKNRYLWLGLSGMGISALLLGWDYVDNHFYLTNYWLAACTISLFLGASLPVLAFNARCLVGLGFLFATIWKYESGYWADGSFIYFLSIFDLRVLLLVGQLFEPTALLDLREKFLVASYVPAFAQGISLPTETSMYWLSKFMTYPALVVEMVLAVLFLTKRPGFLMPFRSLLLILFALGAYTLAPVYGFAFLFSIFGLAQCDEDERMSQLLFVGLFTLAVLLNYAAPSGVGALLIDPLP